MKYIKILISVMLLITVASCGSRKVLLDKTSTSSQTSESTQAAKDVAETKVSTNVEQVVTAKDETTESTTTVVEEEFANPLPGQPAKRKTTTTKGTLTDKGKITASKESKDTTGTKSSETLNNKTEGKQEAKSEHKDTISDTTVSKNLGGPGVIIGIVLIVVLVGALYFYLKK